jgi:hypothetical protein
MQLPICAVCKRPVTRLTAWHGAAEGSMVYVAECHGAKQCVELTARQMEGAGPHGIVFGEAFSEEARQLPPP